MRIISAIDRPLQDEHVIAVDPPLRPELPGVWRRRINPFTGRSLSDRALTAEQDVRSGIQRLRGQSVTAGIINGLDVMLEPAASAAAPGKAVMQILPGLGLTQAGEDIVIGSARRISLGNFPVHARVDHLDAIASGAPAGGPEPEAPEPNPDDAPLPGGVMAGLKQLRPRRLGPRLAQIITAPAADDLPRVAVLVAEPVSATILGRPNDDCPRDPRDDPYDDLQRIDGCRLVLAFWPSEMVAVAGGPDYSLPAAGPGLRNRLAYRIFSVERGMVPEEIHPWEQTGVPLALVSFKQDWTLDFIDRASVVRLGGQPKPRTPIVILSGTPLLWQARVAQFVEHLSALPDFQPATFRAAFRQLPPVGFLPAELIDLKTRRQAFFPAGFSISAAPVPIEQVDLVVRDSASLVPLNLDVPDGIELLVPVPDRVYEPGLLETATVDPEFQRTMTRYIDDRSGWMIRRELVRRRRDLLIDGMRGTRASWPASDSPPDEVLPYPNSRAPLTATRVRRMTAGAALQRLQLFAAGSSLELVVHDCVYLWMRIVSATGLTGFSLRLGKDTHADGTGDFNSGVFWGSPASLPLAAGDANIGLRSQGNLPQTGSWIRLEIPIEARWTAAGGTLLASSIDGLELAQVGGTIEWGPIGKIDSDGNETIWIADDAPPGSTLRNDAGAPWTQSPAGTDDPPVEGDFGTAEKDGFRATVALDLFRAGWTQSFLTDDFNELNEVGLDGFIQGIEARLKATNDAIDLGFARAQTDIYRVRQYILGGDAASKLVTSPALADLAVRDEGARAKSADLSNFIKAAYQTSPTRDPNAPVDPVPKATTPPGAAAPPAAAPPAAAPPPASGSRNILLAGARFSNTISAGTAERVAPSIVAAPVSAAPFLAAQPVVVTNFNIGATAGIGTVPTLVALQPSAFVASPGISALRASASFDRKLIGSLDVQGQLPLPGAVERTASIAERLTPAPSVEAYQYAIAGKLAVISALAGLMADPDAKIPVRPKGVALGDLPAPGFKPKDNVKPTVADVITDSKSDADPRFPDADLLKPEDAHHEADYFRVAVSAIDNTIALMRLVEGRIDFYNKLVADARSVRGTMGDQVSATDARLRMISVELEEARHDVGVAIALLAEEQDRIDTLNARRAAILAANATTVIFRRARHAGHIRVVPTAQATAALAEPPVAVCLRDHDELPEEIRDYGGLFRNAPVSWFPAIKDQLDLLDRLDAARTALLAARSRAAVPFLTFAPATATAPKMLAAVNSVLVAQHAILDRRRVTAMQMDVSAIAIADLSNVKRALSEAASLGDLIAGEHNRPTLSRLATSEIESVGQVAACLYASFGDVPPIIRLEWAEILSEFDLPAPLSTLSSLPRWNTLSLDMRRTQQGFVDWLFSRIDRNIADAAGAMNDLVRVCLLMAAHAPVDRIVPAKLIAPSPARVGVRLDLALDVRLARVGMTALIRAGNAQPIAHAVVEDLAEGVARARIVKTFQPAAIIATTARIDLSHTKLV